MKNLNLFLLFIILSKITYSQSKSFINTQNELPVKNTLFFSFKHKITTENLSGEDFFKPYIFYTNNNGNIIPQTNQMFDSFVLVDDYFQALDGLKFSPTKGIYDSEHLEIYSKDLFKRTKLPIVKNNSIFIGKYFETSINYTIDLPSYSKLSNLLFSFDYKINEYVDIAKLGTPLFIGVEYFDANNKKINKTLNLPNDWRYSTDWYNCHLKTIHNLNINGGRIESEIPIPIANIKTIKVHIVNYELGKHSSINVSNIKLIQNNLNLIDIGDSNLDANYNENTTKWIYDKIFTKAGYGNLFKKRTPIFSDIGIASRSNSSKVPISIILMIPSFDFDYYSSPANFRIYKEKINHYINNIDLNYQEWLRINPEYSNVKIIGMYVIQEGLYSPKIKEILDHIKTKLNEKNWLLFGSPYSIYEENNTMRNSFSEINSTNFNIIWQQPNAFFKLFDEKDSINRYYDSNLLQVSSNYIKENNLNVNIETNDFRDKEDSCYTKIDNYGRVNDYFWYGIKYGYVNYSKAYFDYNGMHHNNAYNESNRIDYDNLYKFISKSNDGVVINSSFEEVENNSFYNWIGSYKVKKNYYSYDSSRKLQLTIDKSNNLTPSNNINIIGGEDYTITYTAKESFNDNKIEGGVLGIVFFDNNNNPIKISNTNTTNLQYSDYLSNIYNTQMYYKYHFSTTSFTKDFINFKAPLNAKSFKLFLGKWRDANIEFKNIMFKSKTDNRVIYLGNDNILNVENNILFGNNSLLLEYNSYSSTKEKISIDNNKIYNFNISVKEELPIKNENKIDKALFGFELFNKNGKNITKDISLPGFSYTENTNTPIQYKYLNTFSQEWTNNNTKINFPKEVSSIKVHLYNWYYDNNLYFDNIQFYTDSQNLNISSDNINTSNQNQFNNEKWTQNLPLILQRQNPIFYNEYINISNIEEFEFSLKIKKENINGMDKAFVAFEFFDNNYNILTKDDINTQSFQWSDYTQTWWLNEYINSNNICNNYAKWYENRWSIYSRKLIKIPDNISYMKISFNNLDESNNNYIILNPTIKFTKIKSNPKFIDYKKTSIKPIDDNIIYINSEKRLILLDKYINEFISIYNLNGKLVYSSLIDSNYLNLNLPKGVYIVKISNLTKKIIVS